MTITTNLGAFFQSIAKAQGMTTKAYRATPEGRRLYNRISAREYQLGIKRLHQIPYEDWYEQVISNFEARSTAAKVTTQQHHNTGSKHTVRNKASLKFLELFPEWKDQPFRAHPHEYQRCLALFDLGLEVTREDCLDKKRYWLKRKSVVGGKQSMTKAATKDHFYFPNWTKADLLPLREALARATPFSPFKDPNFQPFEISFNQYEKLLYRDNPDHHIERYQASRDYVRETLSL